MTMRHGCLPEMNGNFLGMTGRATPFWNLQSTRLMLVASILMSTSPLLGDGIGTSTCWEGNSAGHGDQWIRRHA